MLEQDLNKLGISNNEAKVYLELAALGKCTAQQISRRAKIPRGSVYFFLDQLIERGLASSEKKRGTTFFLPHKPQALVRMVEKEQQEIETKLDLAQLISKQLEPFFENRFYSVPSIQFFDGAQAVEGMLFEYLDSWMQQLYDSDNIWWGFQDHKFVELNQKFLELYWNKKPKDQRVQLFSNDALIEKKLAGKVKNREIRSVPPQFRLTSTLWVCGDYIITININDKVQNAFQVKDANLGANLRLIFALLWELTNPKANKGRV
jgi:predicted transcriptional regulator